MTWFAGEVAFIPFILARHGLVTGCAKSLRKSSPIGETLLCFRMASLARAFNAITDKLLKLIVTELTCKPVA
tara:strand:- start:1064 stop:1279 length:216 start_codon:yes stop_codon:yes gene_type:complete